MPKQIQDEFTKMRISRQRKYQLRRERDGKCRVCGSPCDGALCIRHRKLQRKATKRMVLSRKPGYNFI
jgi:hypothetical protein